MCKQLTVVVHCFSSAIRKLVQTLLQASLIDVTGIWLSGVPVQLCREGMWFQLCFRLSTFRGEVGESITRQVCLLYV